MPWVIVRRPSGFIEPCLPSKVTRPPSGPLWVHEIKHDGYQLMVRRGGLRVRCFTRNGHDWWRANSEEHCQHKFSSAARQRMALVSGIFPSCAYRKSNPAILMVQSAQDRAADDIPGPLNAAMDRGILVQRQMSARGVVQRGLRTPTGPFVARFFIGIIPGLVAEFAFMGQSTKLVMSSSAAR
jgi:hypothetical protein